MGDRESMNDKRSMQIISRLIPEPMKRVIRPIYFEVKKASQKIDLDPRWLAVQKKLEKSEKIIDLGCGNNPVKGATVGVDSYIGSNERSLGVGSIINTKKMKERGITFVNARIDFPLPFGDKEFDFAYSNHVFEHLEDPAMACKEMMRIAKSGVIITPSILAELIFGRPYHRWLVMDRNNSIFFFRKRPFEDRPFGEHPKWDEARKKWIIENNTNPFDILLNYDNWYRGKEKLPRLGNILRKYWHSHHPIIEVIFNWTGNFEFEIYE